MVLQNVPRVGVSWAGVLSRFLIVQHKANTAGGQLGNPLVPYGERLLPLRQQGTSPQKTLGPFRQ